MDRCRTCLRTVSGPHAFVNPPLRERLQRGARGVGISLDATQLERLEQYFDVLLRWNRKINLTGLPLEGLPDRTLDRIFIEPLQAARLVEDSPLRWFDLGSGGGSPAVPLKVLRPRLRLTLVESRSRKAAFLREVVRSLDLTDIDVLPVRIDELVTAGNCGHADLLTMRGVRVDEKFMRTAATLLRARGRLLLFGSRPPASIDFQLIEQFKLTDGASALYVLQRTEGSSQDAPKPQG